ncbi:MAG: hypothetical protein ACOCZ8_01990 [Bacteroidota bacterium]
MRIFFKNEAQEDRLKQFMVENGIEWETEIPIAEDAATDYDLMDSTLFEITPEDVRNIEKGIKEAAEGQRIPLEQIESEINQRLREIEQELNASKN